MAVSKQLEQKFLQVSARIPYALRSRLFYSDIIRRNIDFSSTSILNVGSGQGRIMRLIDENGRFFQVNLDLFLPYLKSSKTGAPYADCILADAKRLPITKKSFDIVLCLELIEHLQKMDGLKLIKELEAIARRQVILSTPVGFHKTHMFDNNPLQIHRSGWTPSEFKSLKFHVKGSTGLRFLRGERASSLFSNLFLKCLNSMLTHITQLFTYLVPRLSWGIICIKNVRTETASSSKSLFSAHEKTAIL